METTSNQPVNDRSIESFILTSTTIVQVLIILFFGLVTGLNWQMNGRVMTAYTIIPLALAGLIYNFFVWERYERKYPFLSTYIALGFVAIEVIAVVALTGGLESPFLPAVLLILLTSCILGLRAYIYSGIFILTVYALLQLQSKLIVGSFRLLPAQIFYLLFTLVLGYTIARIIDHYVKTAKISNLIVNKMSNTQIDEKLMLGALVDPVIGVNQKMQIVLFNNAAEDLTGWTSQNAINEDLQSVLVLKDNNDVLMKKSNNPFLKVIANKNQIVTDEFHITLADQTKTSFSIAVAPTFDIQGGINGAIAVLHDISSQKNLWRERNEFVSTASHEMRTPVATIEGYLSMATNVKLATIDDRAKTYLEKAHASSVHLGKLFQDLLSVTKIEDSRLKDQRQVFNLADLVDQVSTEMELVAKKRDLNLFTHIGDANNHQGTVVAPVLLVNADPDRMREVLTNLVDNAIKYTQAGNIDVSIVADKSNVKVSVRDSGIGIAENEQKHMFEKFYRVNRSATSEIGGTGLGLFIARNLVELYGGRIWVESSPGHGSTFYFTLPLVKQK